jgi:hypothetical protein
VRGLFTPDTSNSQPMFNSHPFVRASRAATSGIMRTSVSLGNLRRGAFLAATSLATCRASSDLSACAAAADAPKTTSLSWFYNKPVRLRIAFVRHGESALPGRFDHVMGSPQALAMCLAVPASLSVTR